MGGNGLAHVGIERHVAVAVNVRRGFGSQGCFGLAGMGGEMPGLHGVHGRSAQAGGPMAAKEAQGLFEVARVDVDRALDGGHGTACKGDHGNADVLSLNGRVEAIARGTEHLDRRAHHPKQQVNGVDALVHEATAVLVPRAAPRSLAVVGVVAIPAHRRAAVGKRTETTCLQSAPNSLDSRVKTVLVAHCHAHVAPSGRLHNGVGVGHRKRDGLLDNDVKAGVYADEGYGTMGAAGSGDRHEVKFGMGREHGAVVGIARYRGNACTHKQGVGLSWVHIAHGHQPKTRLGHRLKMVGGDAAAAYERTGKGTHVFYSTSIADRSGRLAMALTVSRIAWA